MYSYFHNAILTKMTTHNKKNTLHTQIYNHTPYYWKLLSILWSQEMQLHQQGAIRVATEETSFLCVSFEQIKLQLF